MRELRPAFLIPIRDALAFMGNKRHMKLKFTATEIQVQTIGLNATEWSHPLGRLKLSAEEVPLEKDGLFLDYFEARRVKLYIHRKEATSDGRFIWEMSDDVESSHQSWVARYQTAEKLIRSVLGNNENVLTREEYD